MHANRAASTRTCGFFVGAVKDTKQVFRAQAQFPCLAKSGWLDQRLAVARSDIRFELHNLPLFGTGLVHHLPPPSYRIGCLALTGGDKAMKEIQKSPVFLFFRARQPKSQSGGKKGPAPRQVPMWENHAILAPKFEVLSLFDRPDRIRTYMSSRTGDFKSPASAISPPARDLVILPLRVRPVKFPSSPENPKRGLGGTRGNYYRLRYLSNQSTMRVSRSMRCFGSPLRESSCPSRG